MLELELITYSVSTNFLLELIELFAREVDGQNFLTLFRVSPCLRHVLFSFLTRPRSTRVQKFNVYRADGFISSRRKLVDTLYYVLHTHCVLPHVIAEGVPYRRSYGQTDGQNNVCRIHPQIFLKRFLSTRFEPTVETVQRCEPTVR